MMVIGLGNEFRRDDAVGLIAVRRLRNNGLAAEEHEADLAALMDRWRAGGGVILIDAVWSGAEPGTIHYFDISVAPLDRERFKSSTHALGLADAVELSRALGTLPPHVYLFGVEVRDVSTGVGLSPEVEGALPVLINEVVACAAWSSHTTVGSSGLP
jgi:hydrogenase maturation protease